MASRTRLGVLFVFCKNLLATSSSFFILPLASFIDSKMPVSRNVRSSQDMCILKAIKVGCLENNTHTVGVGVGRFWRIWHYYLEERFSVQLFHTVAEYEKCLPIYTVYIRDGNCWRLNFITIFSSFLFWYCFHRRSNQKGDILQEPTLFEAVFTWETVNTVFQMQDAFECTTHPEFENAKK